MLFFRLRMCIRKLITHIEHGTVIGRTEKGCLKVKFDNGKIKVLNDKKEPIRGDHALGYFIYKIGNRFAAFDRDL